MADSFQEAMSAARAAWDAKPPPPPPEVPIVGTFTAALNLHGEDDAEDLYRFLRGSHQRAASGGRGGQAVTFLAELAAAARNGNPVKVSVKGMPEADQLAVRAILRAATDRALIEGTPVPVITAVRALAAAWEQFTGITQNRLSASQQRMLRTSRGWITY